MDDIKPRTIKFKPVEFKDFGPPLIEQAIFSTLLQRAVDKYLASIYNPFSADVYGPYKRTTHMTSLPPHEVAFENARLAAALKRNDIHVQAKATLASSNEAIISAYENTHARLQALDGALEAYSIACCRANDDYASALDTAAKTLRKAQEAAKRPFKAGDVVQVNEKCKVGSLDRPQYAPGVRGTVKGLLPDNQVIVWFSGKDETVGERWLEPRKSKGFKVGDLLVLDDSQPGFPPHLEDRLKKGIRYRLLEQQGAVCYGYQRVESAGGDRPGYTKGTDTTTEGINEAWFKKADIFRKGQLVIMLSGAAGVPEGSLLEIRSDSVHNGSTCWVHCGPRGSLYPDKFIDEIFLRPATQADIDAKTVGPHEYPPAACTVSLHTAEPCMVGKTEHPEVTRVRQELQRIDKGIADGSIGVKAWSVDLVAGKPCSSAEETFTINLIRSRK